MAAILCTTIGELISTACKALTIPCKACGAGCDKLGELICTPFMPYLVVTFFLNTPAVVYAIKSSVNQSWNCSYELFRWLVINAILSIIHMIAAFYIVNLIREEKPSSALPITATTGFSQPTFMATTGTATTSEPTTTYQNASSNSNSTNFIADSSYDVPGGPNSFQRIKHVLCYDKGMAVYIVIFLFWIVWLGIGVSRRLFYDNDNDYDDGCGDLTQYMNAAIAIGYVWMALVGTAFCCSLICLR
jgi:hypothetical protein